MKALCRLSAAVMLAVNLVLADCASTTAVLQDWVGAPESELLRRWGRSNQITETAGGGEVLEYYQERFLTVPDRLDIGIRGGGQSSHLFYDPHFLVPDAFRGFQRCRYRRISGQGQRLRPHQAVLNWPEQRAQGQGPHPHAWAGVASTMYFMLAMQYACLRPQNQNHFLEGSHLCRREPGISPVGQ